MIVERGQQTKRLRTGETWSSTAIIFRFSVWFFLFKMVLLTGDFLRFFLYCGLPLKLAVSLQFRNMQLSSSLRVV